MCIVLAMQIGWVSKNKTDAPYIIVTSSSAQAQKEKSPAANSSRFPTQPAMYVSCQFQLNMQDRQRLRVTCTALPRMIVDIAISIISRLSPLSYNNFSVPRLKEIPMSTILVFYRLNHTPTAGTGQCHFLKSVDKKCLAHYTQNLYWQCKLNGGVQDWAFRNPYPIMLTWISHVLNEPCIYHQFNMQDRGYVSSRSCPTLCDRNFHHITPNNPRVDKPTADTSQCNFLKSVKKKCLAHYTKSVQAVQIKSCTRLGIQKPLSYNVTWIFHIPPNLLYVINLACKTEITGYLPTVSSRSSVHHFNM